jgi:hypothetical protein
MKTWAVMYALIWVAFLQILIVLFPVFGTGYSDDLHAVVGFVVLLMAYTVNGRIRATHCPDRIKRIVKATFFFSVFQAVLGVALYAALLANVEGAVLGFADFLHVVAAITIITQASSSATAYDMWEEKEFNQAPSPIPPAQS